MIKKYNILSWLLLFSLQSFSQNLSVTAQHIFGTVTEITPDSTQITINNTTGKTVTVTGYKFYDTYGSPAFSTSAGNLLIADGASQIIWVKFSPKQNINHNSEMVILNDSHLGALHVDLHGQGHYTNTYYNQSENLEEEALKTTLQTITGNGYVALGYSNAARDYMFMTLDNKKTNGQGATQNTLECVYTGRNAVGYTDRADCQTNFDFNTEHTFPQSQFNSNEPMKSDLFHLFPTDDVANNTRANFPFGVVSGAGSWSGGGSKFANGIFEPRDAHKGEVGRAMLYFVMRYQNYNNFLDSQEATLRQWHAQFPPTDIERKRCNDIYSVQHDRNPFIDYPQLVDRITSFSTTSVAAVNYSMDVIENAIDYTTVSVGNSYVYQYLIVNNGNQVINFASFSLTPATELFFEAPFSGTNANIQPGDALAVLVRYTPTQAGTLNGSLQFTSSSPSQGTFNVPIHATASAVGLADVNGKQKMSAYPNPFNDHICITPAPSAKAIIRLYDMEGRTLETYNGSSFQSCETISDKLTPGVYVLEVEENGTPVKQMILKN